MLIEMLEEVYPKASYTELESLLIRSRPTEEDHSKRESVAHEYFQYIIDILLSIMVRHNENFHMKTVWIAGSLFSSSWLEKKFHEVLSENLKENLKLKKLSEITQVPSELSLVHGLSLLARELLHTKKDPIIRILRYTLYHYE